MSWEGVPGGLSAGNFTPFGGPKSPEFPRISAFCPLQKGLKLRGQSLWGAAGPQAKHSLGGCVVSWEGVTGGLSAGNFSPFFPTKAEIRISALFLHKWLKLRDQSLRGVAGPQAKQSLGGCVAWEGVTGVCRLGRSHWGALCQK